jgi:hypothetical protein
MRNPPKNVGASTYSSSGPAMKTCLTSNEVSRWLEPVARKHPRRSSWKGPPMPNLPRVKLRAPLRVVAWMLLLLVGLAAPDVAPLADGVGSHDPPTRTAKERLGAKASDEQRVDNCKVPLDRRGPKPRPDECGDSPSTRNHK